MKCGNCDSVCIHIIYHMNKQIIECIMKIEKKNTTSPHETLHLIITSYSVLRYSEHLWQSRLHCVENCSLHALCLWAVLISSPDTWDWMRMHTLVVIHRRTLYENVDTAKIKVPFYTTDINILRVASMYRHTLYRWIVTPLFCYNALGTPCVINLEVWGASLDKREANAERDQKYARET